jgi:hypothetical protein
MWADRLQGNVSVVQRFLSAQSGGKKALRFDMGTACSADEVDITSIRLPHTRDYYKDDFSFVVHDTWTAVYGGRATGRDL